MNRECHDSILTRAPDRIAYGEGDIALSSPFPPFHDDDIRARRRAIAYVRLAELVDLSQVRDGGVKKEDRAEKEPRVDDGARTGTSFLPGSRGHSNPASSARCAPVGVFHRELTARPAAAARDATNEAIENTIENCTGGLFFRPLGPSIRHFRLWFTQFGKYKFGRCVLDGCSGRFRETGRETAATFEPAFKSAFKRRAADNNH